MGIGDGIGKGLSQSACQSQGSYHFGDATNEWVLGLPSFRFAKFRLNDVIIEFYGWGHHHAGPIAQCKAHYIGQYRPPNRIK